MNYEELACRLQMLGFEKSNECYSFSARFDLFTESNRITVYVRHLYWEGDVQSCLYHTVDGGLWETYPSSGWASYQELVDKCLELINEV